MIEFGLLGATAQERIEEAGRAISTARPRRRRPASRS